MSTVSVALISIVLSLILYVVILAKRINRFWKDKGIPYVEPYIFVGNALPTIFLFRSQGEQMKAVCDEFPDEPLVGYYDFMKPTLLVKDASFAEKVLIKDFPHFVNRGFEVNEETNPLDVSLFNMTGKRWRAVRNKFSPIFTTGKLRYMFDQMIDIGNHMTKVIEMETMIGVEMREILGRFAMDIIGSVAFGIDAGNLADGESEFRTMGKKAFLFDTKQLMKFIFFTNFPNAAKKLGITFTRPDVQQYFCKIIRDTIDYRRKNDVHRNDFVDLMLQVRDKGSVEIQTKDPNDDYLNITDNYITDSFEITDDLLIGQAFAFLTAGFEATATIMTYSCYEFAKNPEIQTKLRKEILEKVENQGGKLGYDAVKEMTYLDMCLKETMRKYPPLPGLFRICTKDYTFPNGYTSKAGETVVVFPYSIHNDPKYYHDPIKFDPERFSSDAYQQPCTYLPFGEGPRICIAMRFAIVQMKYGLAKLLMTYKLDLNPKTIEPLVINKKSFLTMPKHPIYFNLEKLSLCENSN